MQKVTMKHGRALMNFDWSSKTREPFTTMARAHQALLDAANGSQAKIEALSSSQDFTPQGRKSQMVDWLKQSGLPALKAAQDAIRKAESAKTSVRTLMDVLDDGQDKTDVGAAMVRAQTRDWLRGLEPSKRIAMLAMKDLEPTIALAIREAPAELSGVTRDQREAVEQRALLALHPDQAKQMEDLDAAVEALESTARMAVGTFGKSAGIGPMEIEVMMGGPTLSERIMARLTDDDDTDPAERPDDEGMLEAAE